MNNLDQKVLNYKGLQYFYQNLTEQFASQLEVENKLGIEDLNVNITGTGNAITTGYYDEKSKSIFLVKGATYNNYSLPTASSTLGGVKTTSTVTSTSGLTACPIIAGVPYYKDSGASNVTLDQLVAGTTNQTIPTSLLPSYVDDVIEYSSKSSFPAAGATGKIYIDTSTNLTYRWSGSTYVEISPSLALGTTSSTAFRGDYGNIAYTHATAKGSAFSSGLYKIATNAEGHVTSAVAAEKTDFTNLGLSDTDQNVYQEIGNPVTEEQWAILCSRPSDYSNSYNSAMKNRHFKIHIREGTESQNGFIALRLGNDIAGGTAGGKRGELVLFSDGTRSHRIMPSVINEVTVNHTLPTVGGILLNSVNYSEYALSLNATIDGGTWS